MDKQMQKRLEAARDEVFRRAGSAYRVNKHLGLFRTTTYGWKKIPRKHLRKLASLTGMTFAEMRPDLYGDEGK